MKWDVRMEGGPFDGDNARIEGAPNYDPDLVPKLWVTPCKNCGGRCGDTIWSTEWLEGGEVYQRESVDKQTHMVKYVYADSRLGPSIDAETEELIPVMAFSDL